MENDSIELNLPENSNQPLIFVYLKIISVPVLVFAIFLLGFFGVISLKVELHSILMLTVLLIIALILARQNAEYGCRAFENKIDNFKIKLKSFIMSHLLIIANKKKSSVSFENFADFYSNNLRNENYSSVATMIFPMFGILGTFISIAISMPEFSSQNINMLEKEISQLLSGVGTAFYISIYGIFLAIWWLYFEKKGISKFQKLIIRYKNATKNFFWEEHEITECYLSEILNANLQTNKSIISNLNSDFSDKLNNTLNQKIKNLDEILDSEREILKESNEKLKSINEMLKKIDISSTAKSYNEISNILQNIIYNLNRNENSKDEKIEKFSNSIEKFIDELSKFSADFKNSINENTKKIEKIFDQDEFESANDEIINRLQQTLSNLDKADEK